MISPGKTIGILGGGQLGRMFAHAAQRLGYRVEIFAPEKDCPAGAVSAREVNADFTDVAALTEFAKSVDVLTYEFENIPVEPLRKLVGLTEIYPRPEVLHICQNRLREKHWLKTNGFPHVPFTEVEEDGDLRAAIARIGMPCVVKTADFGYDGKGQIKVSSDDAVGSAQNAFAGKRAVVERWIDFRSELSIIVARSTTGEMKAFPPSRNIHTRHILDFSTVPTLLGEAVEQEAIQLAYAIAEKLDVVGLLAVELFLTDRGEILVNELAPRPHNSGHYTIDACATSQFEQQVRAVCGLPLGDVTLLFPVTMVNILGDAWKNGEPKWEDLLKDARVRLHLYGKDDPRPGRKMGHFTVSGKDASASFEHACVLKARLYGE